MLGCQLCCLDMRLDWTKTCSRNRMQAQHTGSAADGLQASKEGSKEASKEAQGAQVASPAPKRQLHLSGDWSLLPLSWPLSISFGGLACCGCWECSL